MATDWTRIIIGVLSFRVALAKIFLKIITTRIKSYMYRLGLWTPNQCGFKKIIDRKQYLHLEYPARVTCNQVQCQNVSSICGLYSNTKYRVRIDGHLSTNFLVASGVKQGCLMSPILSNIYIQNDLHEIFDNGCDPVKAGDIFINSIPLADDPY